MRQFQRRAASAAAAAAAVLRMGEGARCCDLDADDGPLEVEAEWDGVSVWIGRIPSHGVCRVVGGDLNGGDLSPGGSRVVPPPSQRVSNLFRGDWRLADDLRDCLDAIGSGLALDGEAEPRLPLATVGPPRDELAWALVTFREAADAATLLGSGLAGWALPDTGQPCDGLLLRRALPAERAKAELEEAETLESTRRDMVRLAVRRIFSWLNRHEQSLAHLFKQIDRDGSGDFDVTEFRAGMLSIGVTFDNETIQAIFSYMDSDGGGCVDTTEFVAFLKFAHQNHLANTASSVLLALTNYFDTTHETLKDLFRRAGQEVSMEENGPDSLVDLEELHESLVAVDIPHSTDALREVMAELDMNSDGVLSFFELTARLSAYRKQRRHAATKILHECSMYLQKTSQSATRIFTKCNKDGTGNLDDTEFHDAMRKMGQTLSADATAELMAELDIDGDATIHVNEFLDKVRETANERAADAKRCRHFFNAADSDGSGYLDQNEMVNVASKMGLSAQVANPEFIEQMMLEIELLAIHSEDETLGAHIADGKISYYEFLEWFLEIGMGHLDKPSFKSSVNLEAPSDEQLAKMFSGIDADGSGSVDFSEVQEAFIVEWPYMDTNGFERAFKAADTDGSGEVDSKEFVQLVQYIVWLNENRHRVQELEDTFGGRIGESEFWYGFQQLGFKGSEGEAKYLYDRHCQQLQQDLVDEGLSLEQYVIWAVMHACVGTDREETASEAQARRTAIMQKELENVAGEYGDIHFVDLAAIVINGMRNQAGSGAQESELRRRFKAVVRTVIELSALVKKAFASCIVRNDSFPDFNDATLRILTQMCYKEEYFSGQSIITQGEQDGAFYIMRRGRVDVIIDDNRTGQMDYGSGFGEIGLLLNIKRTATVQCVTPCEIFALERADYDTLLASLPHEERVGPLQSALDKFWALMTNPHDGSRRPSVDYSTYLKAHIRMSKTLTANSAVEAFDEDEERAVAQDDWAEDCERYHLKVTESLNKSQYYSSMYQLVELWSEDCQLSYAKFLSWIFENICGWDTRHECYVFKAVNEVQAVGDKFEKLKDDAREKAAAEQAAGAEALAVAEEARRQQVEQEAERREQEEAAAAAEQSRMDKLDHMASEVGQLTSAGEELKHRLNALDDEEAELLRRLASGELTAEEAAAIRTRLSAIAAERSALQAALRENELQVELAGLDRKLTELDNEEAELLRRLAAGDLSAEEEAEIRARLAQISAQRESLLQQRGATLTAQRSAAANAAEQKFAAQLAAVDRKLTALNDEEAELLRRLEAGDLSPEEEAEIRARLAAIAAERKSLLDERSMMLAVRRVALSADSEARAAEELAELNRKLAALDGEEAELLRRLEAGDLTAEEEAEVRARLAEIEAERAALRAEASQVQLSAQLADIQGKLAALVDEESELLRRLAAGDLTPEEEEAIRKRLAEIGAERGKLMEAQSVAMRELLESGQLPEAEAAALREQLRGLEQTQLDRKLTELDNEEADLLRRLAAGDLSPEEEAEVRARLAAIAAERAGLHAQDVARIDQQLAALDDEEAELLHRLAAGDLTPEEEAAIRARLANIALQREKLLGQRDDAAAHLERAEQGSAAAEAMVAELSAGRGGRGSADGSWQRDDSWLDPFSDYLYRADYPAAAQASSAGNTRVRAGMNPLNSSQLLWTDSESSLLLQRHREQQMHWSSERQDTNRLAALQDVDDGYAQRTRGQHRRSVRQAERDRAISGAVSAPPIYLHSSTRPDTRLNVREAMTAARALSQVAVGGAKPGRGGTRQRHGVTTLPPIALERRLPQRVGRSMTVQPAAAKVAGSSASRGALSGGGEPGLSAHASRTRLNGHKRVVGLNNGRSRRKKLKLHENPLRVQLRD